MRMHIGLCVVALVCAAVQANPVVKTNQGLVEGFWSEHAAEFLGIPFAQPPVGGNRWNLPQPAASWSPQTLEARSFRAGCPQVCEQPPGLCPPTLSEDCLYLNVYTPINATELLPVLVFFPGGDYMLSGAGVTLYEGRFLAHDANLVVVTSNYRLGALGFLVTGPNITGNYGLFDQWLALNWVQQNIAAFGGDPDRVTISGQSAGAASVAVHLTSPATKGKNYFQRAIIESSTFGIPFRDVAQQTSLGASFASHLGCKLGDMDCFLGKSTDDIVAAQEKTSSAVRPWPHTFMNGYAWSPCIGRPETPLQPMAALAAGLAARVPVILGSTKDEAVEFIWLVLSNAVPSLEYKGIVVALFGVHAATVLEQYPVPSNETSDARLVFSALVRDYLFTCPTRMVARALAADSPTYLYSFDHAMSFPGWGANFSFCDGYACHGVELPFLFHTASLLAHTPTPAEEALSTKMAGIWSSFARGEADHGSFGAWPLYNATTSLSLKMDVVDFAVEQNRSRVACDMWDRIGYLA